MTDKKGTDKIACPFCDGCQSKVINSRPAGWKQTNGFWRRRECLGCGKRFSTEENIRGVYKADPPPHSATTSS